MKITNLTPRGQVRAASDVPLCGGQGYELCDARSGIVSSHRWNHERQQTASYQPRVCQELSPLDCGVGKCSILQHFPSTKKDQTLRIPFMFTSRYGADTSILLIFAPHIFGQSLLSVLATHEELSTLNSHLITSKNLSFLLSTADNFTFLAP